MGTNYYARIIPTKERKKELCELINNSYNWDEIIKQVNTTFSNFEINYDSKPVGGIIHLGKRSGGWKFLWNPNIYIIHNGHLEDNRWVVDPDSYYFVYPLTKNGIWDFINQPNVEVWNEYGEKQDKKEFFDMAINWGTWINHETGEEKEAWDGKSYELYEQSKGHYSRFLPKETDPYIQALISNGFNVNWPYTDFYSDGLRFATNNEFS